MDMNIKFDVLIIVYILIQISIAKNFDLIPGWDKFQQYIKDKRNSEKTTTLEPNPEPKKAELRSDTSGNNPSKNVLIGFNFVHEIDENRYVLPTLDLFIVTPQPSKGNSHQPQKGKRIGKPQTGGKSLLEKNFLKAKSEVLGRKLVNKNDESFARQKEGSEIRTHFDKDLEKRKDGTEYASNNKILTAFFHNINLRTYNQLNKIVYHEPNPNFKTKLSLMAKEYQQVLKSLLDDSRKTSIISQYGKQKIIRSTVDTSARYLRKMLDVVIFETDGDNSKSYLNNTIRTKIDTIIKFEYDNICDKFRICRNGKNVTFVDLLVEMLDEIATLKLPKMKKAVVAIYSYFATDEFHIIMDDATHSITVLGLNLIKKSSPGQAAMIFTMLSNTIKFRHVPIDQNDIHNEMDKHIANKTLILRDWLEMLENSKNVTEEDLAIWNSYMLELKDWVANNTGRIIDIAPKMLSFTIIQPLKQADDATLNKIKEQLKILVQDIPPDVTGPKEEEEEEEESNVTTSALPPQT